MYEKDINAAFSDFENVSNAEGSNKVLWYSDRRKIKQERKNQCKR